MKRNLSHIYTPYSVLFFAFICLLSLFFNNTGSAQEITSSPLNPIKVVDGDSLEIGSHRIRLMGIDAPEYVQYCKNQNNKKYSCGIESLKHLQELIGENNVKCIVHDQDKYNRNLCTCYVNGLNLNAEMVRSGYAITYLGNEYSKEQAEAKLHKRGIWKGRFMHPRLFRRLKEQEKY